MSISFQAKSSPVLSRQLEAQEIVAECNLSASAQTSGSLLPAASSDAPSIVEISGILTARKITLSVGEPISKCFSVQVIDRTTGEALTLADAPDTSVAQKISVTVDGSTATSVCVVFCYKVQE